MAPKKKNGKASTPTTTTPTSGDAAPAGKSDAVAQQKAPAQPDVVSTPQASTDDVAEEAAEVPKGIRGQANKDMENVTGYVEEGKDNLDEKKLDKAMNFITDVDKNQRSLKTTRDKELERIAVSKEDIDLVMAELDLTKQQAERLLRESKGSVQDTLKKFIAAAV
ncbi:hypothetical protein BJ742DRAFT_364241 [Cladochytrium replicatum]|nr:hypothetical protein BJ742DRAFT_364241 [Cladochytrium replicatum]